MPSDIHEAANTTKEGWIAWFCPLKLYRHYSGCRIWSGLLYRNYIKLYVSFCAARPGFVAYLFVVQYTTAVLYRCFYIRFVLPLINHIEREWSRFLWSLILFAVFVSAYFLLIREVFLPVETEGFCGVFPVPALCNSSTFGNACRHCVRSYRLLR